MWNFTSSVRFCCQILMNAGMCQQIFVKLSSIKLHENSSYYTPYVDRRMDMAKLLAAPCNIFLWWIQTLKQFPWYRRWLPNKICISQDILSQNIHMWYSRFSRRRRCDFLSGLVEVFRHFGGTNCPHFPGRRESQATNKEQTETEAVDVAITL